jgi:hypothetical protein
LLSRPPRSEPVAVIGKRPVPPPLQNLHHRLLDESIQHRRDGDFIMHFLQIAFRMPAESCVTCLPILEASVRLDR